MATALLFSLISLTLNLETLPKARSIAYDLNTIKTTLFALNTIVADAEHRERREPPVKRWLRSLNDAAHSAEDALEDLALALAEKQEIVNTSIASRIKTIGESLLDISNQCESLRFVATEGRARHFRASFADESVVFGRDDDKKNIIHLLLSDTRSCLNVVPVVGAAGVGKTTVANLVYNDPAVSDHFDVKVWVSGSHDPNLVKMTTAIIASVDDKQSIYPKLCSLRGTMNWMLEGKRFLIVLDGVGNKDESFWKSLWASLSVGLEGSAVLVTTDDESVASITQTTVPFYRLNPLSDHDCWLLFNGNTAVDENLVTIGKTIIEKCNGSPLAAKMLGILLRSETDEARWHDISQSDLSDSTEATITLCYYGLPAHLRRCFAYCALFPKDYLYRRDTLVRLWMAQGYIRPTGTRRPEDAGVEYLDELLRRGFFQRSPVDHQTFVQNDCIREFAQSISEMHENSSAAYHASVVPQDFETPVRIPSSTRTFLVINTLLGTHCDPYFFSRIHFRIEISAQYFACSEYMRTLDLSGTDIRTLPDSIGALKHLRYLGLGKTSISSLPETVCNLSRLQTLDLADCDGLCSLPQGIKKLRKLRHLLLPEHHYGLHIPPGIGLLTELQTLNTCEVWREGMSSTMREFKDLANLTGELEIKGLENVPDAAEARGVLRDKKNVTKLTLQSGVRCDFRDCGLSDADVEGVAALFADDEETERARCSDEIVPRKLDHARDEDVFDSLQPHTNIMELVVRRYFGEAFPNWIGDPSFLNLVSVTLVGCFGCRVFPGLGRLLSLRHLVVKAMTELPSIDFKGFPSLETVHFGRMDMWEEWLGAADDELPRVHRLELDCCPKLRGIPNAFPSLSVLVIRDCGELTGVPDFPSLESLEVAGRCNEKIWPAMPTLRSLKIRGVDGLALLRSNGFCSLESLVISNCEANATSSWPSWDLLFRDAKVLRVLKVHDCPEMEFSMCRQLPSTIRLLEISDCPLLTKWCYGHGVSKLIHIPRVIVDRKNFYPYAATRTATAGK